MLWAGGPEISEKSHHWRSLVVVEEVVGRGPLIQEEVMEGL